MNTRKAVAVLFVDDEPRVLKGLERMLHGRRQEWTMCFAASAEEALALLEREAFDAMVTDLRMPGLDGVELLRSVQKQWPQTARIVLSGEMDQQAALKTVGCAHQYLLKPCDPERLQRVLEQIFANGRLVDDRNLRSLLARMDTLPSLPAIYVEIQSEIQSPNASFRKVGELIARDVSMTAKILQMVNSAFFGLARRIGSPQEAVALLGLDTVTSLVLSAKIFAQFNPRRIAEISLEELWRHSLETSFCARAIGIAENLPRHVQDEAFTAGLLHDLGKPVLAQNFPEEYRDLMRRARSGRSGVEELERECFGVCHAKLGAYLMGLWGMAEGVVAAIAFHHRPADSSMDHDILVGAVHAANAIEHQGVGSAAQRPAEDGGLDLDYLGRGNRTGRLPVWRKACQSGRSEGGGTCRTGC